MKNTKRRGFTLVELLVVIAILAILATVSIVGYSVFIKKANTSADQQAVTQINVLLEGLQQSNEPKDVQSLFDYLKEAGLDAEDYKPLVKDTYFYWDKELNRVLYVDAQGTVMYPEKLAGTKQDGHYWQSLSGTIPTGTDTTNADRNATVDKGSDYVEVAKSLANGKATSITLNGTVDCMGAAIDPDKAVAGNTTISGGTDDATLRGAVSMGFASQHDINSASKAGKQYKSGIFFSEIPSRATVTIENLVLDGIVTGNYETGITGLICGTLSGNLTIENLTIKNCTVYGMNKVGLIAGYMTGGQLNITNLTIENSRVLSSEGEAALLVGMIDGSISNDKITISTISIDDASSVEVIADQYHQIVTLNKDTVLTSGAKTFKPATTQYITKIDSYYDVRTNGFTKETKTVDGKDCITLAPVPVGQVLAWKYDTTDKAAYFTAEGLPKVDGKPTAIRHIECFTTVGSDNHLAN